MAREGQVEIPLRIVIENPVDGVWHSLQAKDGHPLNPQKAMSGHALRFDFPVRVAPGPKFFGDQVRREEKERRFVYICIGQSAGDHGSPWSRRMKIDIHDLPAALLDRAMAGEGTIEIVVDGTGKDGTPACATVRPTAHRLR